MGINPAKYAGGSISQNGTLPSRAYAVARLALCEGGVTERLLRPELHLTTHDGMPTGMGSRQLQAGPLPDDGGLLPQASSSSAGSRRCRAELGLSSWPSVKCKQKFHEHMLAADQFFPPLC